MKAFFKRLIQEKTLKKFLKNHDNNDSVFEYKKFKNVICLVDADIDLDIPSIYKIPNHIGIHEKNFLVISVTKCIRNVDKKLNKKFEQLNRNGIKVIYYDDINVRGALDSDEVKKIIKKQNYDLLINLFDIEKLHLLYISAKIKTRFRVGSTKINYGYNNLIIDVPITNIPVFSRILLQCIKTFNVKK